MKFFSTLSKLLLVGLICTCCISCETIIEIEQNEDTQRLVINSVLKQNRKLKIRVSESVGPLDTVSNYPQVTDAEVLLFVNGELLDTVPYDEDIEKYTLPDSIVNLRPDNTYRIEVRAEGLKTVSAETTIPPKISIISAVVVDTFPISIDGVSYLEINVEFQDLPEENNYYYIQPIAIWNDGDEDEFCFYTIGEEFVDFGTDVTEVVGLVHHCGWAFFNDQIFDGEQHNLRVLLRQGRFNNVTSDGEVQMHVYHLSEDFYRYLLSRQVLHNTQNSPFAQPVVVHSNVENGFGIFSGSALRKATVTY